MLYNRTNGHLKKIEVPQFNQEKKFKDFFAHLILLSFVYSVNDSTFCTYEEPYSILETMATFKKQKNTIKLTKEEEAFISSIKEDDNPILMLVKIKEF